MLPVTDTSLFEPEQQNHLLALKTDLSTTELRHSIIRGAVRVKEGNWL